MMSCSVNQPLDCSEFAVQEKKTKEALTRKQEKNRSKFQKNEEEDGPTELLTKPKDYIVKFSFPDPPPLQPPILGLYSKYRE